MLNNETIQLMANRLQEKNLIITSKPNSIVGLSRDMLTPLLPKVAIKIGNLVKLVRNSILPLKKEYADAVVDMTSPKLNRTTLDEYIVKSVYLPSILVELENRGTLKTISKLQYLDTRVVTANDVADGSIIRDILLDIQPGLKEGMEELLMDVTDDDLIHIWAMYMTHISKDNGNISRLPGTTTSDLSTLCILVMLLDSLSAAIPDNVTIRGDHLPIFAEYKTVLITNINRIIDGYNLSVRANRLVILKQRTVHGGTVYVNGPVLKEFVKDETVSIQAIRGLIYDFVNSDEPVVAGTMHEVKENNAYFKEIWRKAEIRDSVVMAENDKTTYKMGYVLCLRNALDGIDELLAGYTDYTSKSDMTKVEEYITSCTPTELKDIDKTTENILAKVVFTKLDYIRLLEHMRTYKATNPDMSVMETATFATLELVIDYYIDQVTVTRHG